MEIILKNSAFTKKRGLSVWDRQKKREVTDSASADRKEEKKVRG